MRRDGKEPEGEGYPIEDTWNCSELDPLHSIQIISFSKEKVGDAALTQKNENLLERMILTSSNQGDTVLDFFVGSGTTCAAAQKMGRKWIGVEMGAYFDQYTLPRMKKVLFGDKYGISSKYGWKGGGVFKYMTVESYEDTLNNLSLKRTDVQDDLLGSNPALREEYMLSYMLDFETKGSSSLLDLDGFEDPFSYKLNIIRGEETCPENVDLIETFNYLLGLTVSRRHSANGYRVVEGANPAGERVLVIWRNTKEKSNDDLATFFEEQGYAGAGFDRVYANGDNTLALKAGDSKVHLIEEEFRRLMFETEGL